MHLISTIEWRRCPSFSEFTSNATLIPVYLVNASIQNKTTAQHILNAGSDSSKTAFCSMVREWQTKTSRNCIIDSRDKIAAVIGKKEENCITLELRNYDKSHGIKLNESITMITAIPKSVKKYFSAKK